MKKAFLIFGLIVFSQMFSQKKYHFDYALAVKESYKLKDLKSEFIFLVNSEHNNYRLYAHSKINDLTNFTLLFIDDNGVSFNGNMSKSNFDKVETIAKTCNEVFRFSNPHIKRSKNYSFVNYQDTIINNTAYYHYAIKCNKSLKFQKKKKIYTVHYIVDKSDSNFLPFTYSSLIYEIWKTSVKIPNGFPKLVYFVNSSGEETGKMEFTILKVDKYATIPEECDFTLKDVRNNLYKIL